MMALKFLGPGHVGVISGFDWPVGSWVESTGAPIPGLRGVHACRTRDLPYWVAEELWTIELDGDAWEGDRFVVARRGRLVAPVEGWPDLLAAFTAACVERIADVPGFRDDIVFWAGQPGGEGAVSYIAAHAKGERGAEFMPAFLAERAWQAGWFADHLGPAIAA